MKNGLKIFEILLFENNSIYAKIYPSFQSILFEQMNTLEVLFIFLKSLYSKYHKYYNLRLIKSSLDKIHSSLILNIKICG